MLLLILLIEMSPIAGDKILWFTMCQFFSIVLWSIPYHITKSVFLANVYDDPLDDIFVFVRRVVVSFAGCTVLGLVKFRLCRYCHTLRSVGA